MNLKKVQEAKLKGKRVLVRADFNVMLENGRVRESFRIAAARENLEYILAQEPAQVALLSHWGRPPFSEITRFEKSPGGKGIVSVLKKFSLANLLPDAEKILGFKIKFVPDCVGPKVVNALSQNKSGDILLLENVRLRSGDEINDLEYAAQLAEPFDVFVNDAFSVCHRDQSSVTGITSKIPSYAGIRLQKEVENLQKVKENPAAPAVAIVGGTKIETKLPLIKMLERNYDSILVGGRLAVEAQNNNLTFSDKVFLPVDYAEGKKDIGRKTIDFFKEKVRSAKTIVWNGPLGKFEEAPFAEGTIRVLEVVIVSGAFSVVGGGESLQILEEKDWLNKVSFASTGGGAMLEYLSGNDLPGLQCLMA